MRFALLTAAAVLLAAPLASAQAAGDCPYPVLFVHGYTGSQVSWEPFTGNADVAAIWGPRADVFHAVLNAYENEERIAGPDGIRDTADDDVLVAFANLSNVLAPGCVYAANWENWWNESASSPQIEINGGDSPGGFFASESDSNEEAAQKQGYALGRMIQAVLAANPGKDRVVLVGHSMGGLAIREYLQRRDGAGTPLWWAVPSEPDGHRVARVLTVGTPHRGSNFFGNPFTEAARDGTPDINSAAVRDLRQSYFCFFCNSPGPYLFGGGEGGIASGFHTDDVDLDGDESSLITGINVDGRDQGFGDAQDGTTDNPAMPLPAGVRYTWLTSDVGTSGDLVVDLARQWIYDGAVPVPSDGVPYRLADTLLTDVFHLAQQEDTDAVARGLDEPDYPAHAYRLLAETTYAATATVRSQQAPDGAATSDPDWFVLDGDGPFTVTVVPTPGLGGRLDAYADPDAYTTADGAASATWAAGSGPVTLDLGAGRRHVRVTHDGVVALSWRTPYTVRAEATQTLPLELLVAPFKPPVTIPAQGGVLGFAVRLQNPGVQAATVDLWTDAVQPDGSVWGPLLTETVPVPAQGSLRFRRIQNIPGDAAPGAYTYRVRIGTLPDDVQAEASFPFEKAAGVAPSVVSDWAVTEGEPAALTGAVTLGAPRPNPLRSATTVPLHLDAPADVTVTVLDALGRRVATLWDGPLGEGAHALRWDADVAPGPYVVRVSTGAEGVAERVVVTR